MREKIVHPWQLNPDDALMLQRQLANRVVLCDDFGTIGLVAGVDVAYKKNSDEIVAGVVVLQRDSLEVVESVWSREKVAFPYVPGLFSFRELPSILSAVKKLKCEPDLFVCDGQGIAHPLRFGLACHLGVVLDVPSIGCAKTRLIGEHAAPGEMRGCYSFLEDGGEVVGAAVRTQNGINPVFVSPGHRVSLSTAIELVLELAPNYRLPETTRASDQLVRQFSSV